MLHAATRPTAAAAGPGRRQIAVRRTAAELAPLASAGWNELPWGRIDANMEYLLAVAEARREALCPYVAAVVDDGRVVAGLAGRLEDVRLDVSIGYRTVYRPRLRVLQMVPGGVFASDDGAAAALVDELDRCLGDGEIEALLLPGVRDDGAVRRSLDRLPAIRRGAFAQRDRHWRLELPDSADSLLASLTAKARGNLVRRATRLERDFGRGLGIRILRQPTDFDRIVEDLERVAARTYQRGLGAGFARSPEQLAATRTALEHGWLRVYVLDLGGMPAAFWQGYARGDTFYLGNTGYDPSYASHGVGLYLHLRMLDDLCADPAIRTLDYGAGDAAYKRLFATESWLESDLMVFAPSVRALRINLVRTAVAGADACARRALDRSGLTDAVKRRWRRRLRAAGSA